MNIKTTIQLALAIGILLTAGCSRPVSPETGGDATTPPAAEEKPAAESPSAPTEEPADEPVVDTAELSSTFGFADESGQFILYMVQAEKEMNEQTADFLPSLNRAIGESGQLLGVRYAGHQERDAERDSGRQTADNFNDLEGERFEVVAGTAVANQTYYLTNDTLFPPQSLLPVIATAPVAPDESVRQDMEQVRERAIEHMWEIATFGADSNEIYLVQFARQGNDMLASLAVKLDGQWTCMDYPAVYNESSTWRVDDGGVISPDMFGFLFAAAGRQGTILAVKWVGAEGEVVSLLEQSGNRFVESAIHSYRYMSPA